MESVAAEERQPVFQDALFRQKRKNGRWRIVCAPQHNVPIADTHAHLQLLADPAVALARAAANGVGFLCTIVDVWEDGSETFECLSQWMEKASTIVAGIHEANRQGLDSPDVVGCIRHDGTAYPPDDMPEPDRLSRDASGAELPTVRIACGCHPHNAKHYTDELEASLAERLKDPRVVAVGEIGLDYHYDYSPRDEQKEAFRRQIRLAKSADKPIVLHMREAHDDGFAILQEEGFPEQGTLLHCFNLDEVEVSRWVEAGCYIAFGGPLTFKKADEVRAAAKRVPIDRLLTETDAPYMTPEPMRGCDCWPDHVVFTAALLADVYGFKNDREGRDRFLRKVYDNAWDLLLPGAKH